MQTRPNIKLRKSCTCMKRDTRYFGSFRQNSVASRSSKNYRTVSVSLSLVLFLMFLALSLQLDNAPRLRFLLNAQQISSSLDDLRHIIGLEDDELKKIHNDYRQDQQVVTETLNPTVVPRKIHEQNSPQDDSLKPTTSERIIAKFSVPTWSNHQYDENRGTTSSWNPFNLGQAPRFDNSFIRVAENRDTEESALSSEFANHAEPSENNYQFINVVNNQSDIVTSDSNRPIAGGYYASHGGFAKNGEITSPKLPWQKTSSRLVWRNANENYVKPSLIENTTDNAAIFDETTSKPATSNMLQKQQFNERKRHDMSKTTKKDGDYQAATSPPLEVVVNSHSPDEMFQDDTKWSESGYSATRTNNSQTHSNKTTSSLQLSSSTLPSPSNHKERMVIQSTIATTSSLKPNETYTSSYSSTENSLSTLTPVDEPRGSSELQAAKAALANLAASASTVDKQSSSPIGGKYPLKEDDAPSTTSNPHNSPPSNNGESLTTSSSYNVDEFEASSLRPRPDDSGIVTDSSREFSGGPAAEQQQQQQQQQLSRGLISTPTGSAGTRSMEGPVTPGGGSSPVRVTKGHESLAKLATNVSLKGNSGNGALAGPESEGDDDLDSDIMELSGDKGDKNDLDDDDDDTSGSGAGSSGVAGSQAGTKALSKRPATEGKASTAKETTLQSGERVLTNSISDQRNQRHPQEQSRRAKEPVKSASGSQGEREGEGGGAPIGPNKSTTSFEPLIDDVGLANPRGAINGQTDGSGPQLAVSPRVTGKLMRTVARQQQQHHHHHHQQHSARGTSPVGSGLQQHQHELLVGPFKSEAEAPETITLSGVVYQKSGRGSASTIVSASLGPREALSGKGVSAGPLVAMSPAGSNFGGTSAASINNNINNNNNNNNAHESADGLATSGSITSSNQSASGLGGELAKPNQQQQQHHQHRQAAKQKALINLVGAQKYWPYLSSVYSSVPAGHVVNFGDILTSSSPSSSAGMGGAGDSSRGVGNVATGSGLSAQRPSPIGRAPHSPPPPSKYGLPGELQEAGDSNQAATTAAIAEALEASNGPALGAEPYLSLSGGIRLSPFPFVPASLLAGLSSLGAGTGGSNGGSESSISGHLGNSDFSQAAPDSSGHTRAAGRGLVTKVTHLRPDASNHHQQQQQQLAGASQAALAATLGAASGSGTTTAFTLAESGDASHLLNAMLAAGTPTESGSAASNQPALASANQSVAPSAIEGLSGTTNSSTTGSQLHQQRQYHYYLGALNADASDANHYSASSATMASAAAAAAAATASSPSASASSSSSSKKKHHPKKNGPIVIVQKEVKPVKYYLLRAYLRLRRLLRPAETTYIFPSEPNNMIRRLAGQRAPLKS